MLNGGNLGRLPRGSTSIVGRSLHHEGRRTTENGLFFQPGYLANLAISRRDLARMGGQVGSVIKLVAEVATVAGSRDRWQSWRGWREPGAIAGAGALGFGLYELL